MRKIVTFQLRWNIWEVWDRQLLAVRGQYVRKAGAECAAAQLELDL